MKLKLEDLIEKEITSITQKLGYEIEYVENVNESNQNIIRVVIDKKDSVITLDDCETVSRAVEDVVDELVTKEFVLEISSPGLERQLKNMKLYKKYINSEIFIRLFKKIELGKEIIGILQGVDEQNNSINIKCEDKNVELKLKDIATAYTTYDFDSVLKSNKNVNLNELKKF